MLVFLFARRSVYVMYVLSNQLMQNQELFQSPSLTTEEEIEEKHSNNTHTISVVGCIISLGQTSLLPPYISLFPIQVTQLANKVTKCGTCEIKNGVLRCNGCGVWVKTVRVTCKQERRRRKSPLPCNPSQDTARAHGIHQIVAPLTTTTTGEHPALPQPLRTLNNGRQPE